jgi:ATP-dependent DNA helicase DinG
LQYPGLLSLQPRATGFLLYQLPVTVMDAMSAWLAKHKDRPLLLTSSTLSVPNQQQSLMQQLALPEQNFHRLLQAHPWQQRALLYLPRLVSMPNDANYAAVLTASVCDFLAVVPGRILMLFSSYRALGEVAELLAQLCQRPLFVQGDQTESELVKQFIAMPGGVLLGTGSFWEGVDLAQAQLAAVIIDKLPFASPVDPTVALRSRHLRSQGIDAFQQYQLPQAALKLKQGVGRLLRREHDKGVIMLADPRIESRPYGAFFLAALPDMPQTESLAEVGRFFAGDSFDAPPIV